MVRRALLFALLVTACGNIDEDVTVVVSTACDEQMLAASNEPDIAKAEPLIRETATDCTSVAEWLTALRRYPAAMGLGSAEVVGDVDVKALCGPADMAETPVCRDAVAEGILPADWWR